MRANAGRAVSEGEHPAFTVVHEIRPRFRDSDSFGHINNAVYITYMEVARQEYWRSLQAHQDYDHVPFILAHITCDFRSEALVKEVLEIGIRCHWIGDKSFSFAYEMRETETRRVVIEGETVQVCYDYPSKKSISMPDDLRRAFETFEGRPLSRR